MAFVSKIGNLLKQTVSKHTNLVPQCNPSLYQAVRCMSSSKVFVGGLPYAMDETSLREVFAEYGDVVEARIIINNETGRSRGFGFVSYASSDEASRAIQALDGKDFQGRWLKVNSAVEKRPRDSGFGGSDRGYGYGAASGGYGANGGEHNFNGYGGGNHGSGI
ncbi:glycine-rich RNA-binding protein 3, mitochondrial-like isoform X2 [Diospyros lotus]|nr:glycine-rich RNA-binding protein 3, mitochondrial-like isoform X2 [Diospyros lotus]XP_052195027.1 glycine-rich RNA-binding protein 3, mitochondrial-like isoform X2 [Diospyros lotus]XP_052195028.1 glycine-rich RNA-binding protein 3, mitochondrial-like isoform X2 [Diospyros lotus]